MVATASFIVKKLRYWFPVMSVKHASRFAINSGSGHFSLVGLKCSAMKAVNRHVRKIHRIHRVAQHTDAHDNLQTR